MNFLDILFGIPLLWFAYKGFSKGLVVEIASLVALIAGIWLAVNFSWYVGGYLGKIFNGNPKHISSAAFAITFIGVVILMHLLGKMVSKMVEKIALGFLNKLAGGAFGLLKVAFIISVVLYLYGSVDTRMTLIPQELRKESLLYEPVEKIAPVVIPKLRAEKDKILSSPSAP